MKLANFLKERKRMNRKEKKERIMKAAIKVRIVKKVGLANALHTIPFFNSKLFHNLFVCQNTFKMDLTELLINC